MMDDRLYHEAACFVVDRVVMQLVVAATNQNALYTSRLRANKDIFSVYNSRYRFALISVNDFILNFSQTFA
jgi:hypothetical protein